MLPGIGLEEAHLREDLLLQIILLMFISNLLIIPGVRSENQQKLMLLRSTFVLYIFALHILVFIKISL
ncbi:hypothetical protein SLA2020_338110 [Shorea laevis]